MARPVPNNRGAYRTFRTLTTRWADNDIYGHMNNVVHYELSDTAINGLLIEHGVFDIHHGTDMFLVVETGCRYFAEMAFPDIVTARIRVATLGTSSVCYEIGLFWNEEDLAAAEGHFVHVNVNRQSRRPAPFSQLQRSVLLPLLAAAQG